MAVNLSANVREDLTRSHTRELRNSGLVPAVVYGKGKDPRTVSVDGMDLLKLVRTEGRNAIIKLEIDGEDAVNVMVHEYQMDPIRDELLHVDFLAIDLSEEIDVEVNIRVEGNPIGVSEGGVLQQPLFTLQVRAIPSNIPEEIVVDVSDLAIGDVIAVGDLPESDEYEYLDDAETPVVSVIPPETGDIDEPSTDESVEPELVGAEDEDTEE